MKVQIFKTKARQLYQNERDEFRFRIVARNGQIVAQSEGYTTKQSAKKTIKSLKKSLRDAPIEDMI